MDGENRDVEEPLGDCIPQDSVQEKDSSSTKEGYQTLPPSNEGQSDDDLLAAGNEVVYAFADSGSESQPSSNRKLDSDEPLIRFSSDPTDSLFVGHSPDSGMHDHQIEGNKAVAACILDSPIEPFCIPDNGDLDQKANISGRAFEQNSSNSQEDRCQALNTFQSDANDNSLIMLAKSREVKGDALVVKAKNVTNCPGAVIADTVQQNIYKEKHVHVQSTSLNAITEDTQRCIENHLDLKRHVETRATRRAAQLVKRHGKVMITGRSKQGKTTTTLYLAKMFSEDKTNPFTPVELVSPDQWTHLLPEKRYIVILDDLLGTSLGNIESKCDQWSKVLKQILNRVEKGNVILIMTCAQDISRKCILSRTWSNVFDRAFLLSLSSDEFGLRKFEKVHILEKLLSICKVKHSKKELTEACEVSLEDQFLECCEYFFQNWRTQKLKIAFFKHPYQMVMSRMSELYNKNKTQFLALIKVALASLTTIDLAKLPFNISEDISKVELDPHDENLCPEYLSLVNNNFQFRHTSFLICAFLALSNIDISLMVKMCPIEILANHTTTQNASTITDGKILLSRELYQELSSRLGENLKIDLRSTLSHDCFSDKNFLMTVDLIDMLRSNDPVIVLRTAIKYGHTALVEMFLKGNNLDLVDPETKHELLHEAFDVHSFDISHQLFTVGERICDLCFLRMCSSEKKLTDLEDLDSLFGADTLESLSMEVIDKSLKELFIHGQTEMIKWVVSKIEMREDFAVLKESMLYSACKHGQMDVYSLIKETADPFPTPDRLLSYASEGGNLDIVKDLLSKGGNPNAKTHIDLKPIHLACKGNHDVVAKELLLAGADIRALTSFKESVLHVCCSRSPSTRPATLNWILKEYLSMLDLEGKNIHGWTPLHVAASVGNIDSVRQLTKAGAHVSSHDNSGNTPLHCHVMGENPNTETVDHLLHVGADLDARNGSGETPLQLLVRQNTTDRCRVFQYLVSKTKELNSLDNNGYTILHALLAYGCNPEEAEIVIEGGADVNARDEDGNTVLHQLASSVDHSLIKVVLERGAKVLARDRHGLTPLHRAVCVPNNLKTVEQLVSLYRIGEDHSIYTPLHVACEKSLEGGDTYVQLLVQHQPTAIEVPNAMGQTALYLASGSGGNTASAVVETLLNHKADVRSKDRYNNTPLHAACISCRQHSCQIIQILLVNDADIHCTNGNMDTPLHVACHSDGPHKSDVINTLVAFGSRLTVRNRDGCTPSDIALSRGDVEIANSLSHAIITGACFFGNYKGSEVLSVWKETPSLSEDGQTIVHKVCEISGKHSRTLIRELVNFHCSVNAKDVRGKTPLHMACEASGRYSDGIVKELLAHGANINDKDQAGNNALHFACTAKTDEAAKVVQILVESKANVDDRDNFGDTPLHKVCQRQGDYIYKIIQSLINCGASIDDYNSNGLTPFDLITQTTCPPKAGRVLYSTKLWCICNGKTELKEQGVKYFLKQGASLDHKHMNGDTLLHKICSQKGKFTLKNAKLILSLGADPHAKNDQDQTPYDIAVFSENLDIAELVAKKQETTEVKMSGMDKLNAGVKTGSECCEFIGTVYDESQQALSKAADAVRGEHSEFAEGLQIVAEAVQISTKLAGGGKKFFDFFINFNSDKE